jgi:hypothetical protein
MATMFVPAIASSEYPSFRLILKDLPRSYSEWLQNANKVSLEHDATGGTSERIGVVSAEFVRYCKMSRTAPSVPALWTFAHEKSKGHEY